MSGRISYSRETIESILADLEVLVPSLDRLGSHYASADPQHRAAAVGTFVEDWSVFRRLSEMRRLLSEPFDYDDLELKLGNIPAWSPSQTKPPSGTT